MSSPGKPPPLPVNVHDVDYIGTGTFQVTQMGLLQRRSMDINKTSESILSARGLQHRTKNYFVRDIKASTAVIGFFSSQALLLVVLFFNSFLDQSSEQSHHGAGSRKVFSPHLFNTHFQRAVGYERIGKIDKSVADYTTCISMDPKSAPSYFNRSGLYTFLGRLDDALADLNHAVELDPGNMMYRHNRALVERRRGNFDGAIADTLMCKAIEVDPSIVKDLESGEEVLFDSELLLANRVSEDPVRACLRCSKGERPRDENFEAVVKFISSLNMFRGISPNREGLENIAQYVNIVYLEAGTNIFDEGDPCDMFYIVFEGLIHITKKVRTADRAKSNVLVRLSSGQSFGDANLGKPGGVRTAGAHCGKRSALLTLTAEDYSVVMAGYRRALHSEVRHVIATCPVFKTWDNENIIKLAETAARRSYSAGSSILSVGDSASNLYMVIRGVVKLIKPIPRPKVNDINVGGNYIPSSATGLGAEPPGLWVRELNWRERLDLDEKAMIDETSGMRKVHSEFTVGVVWHLWSQIWNICFFKLFFYLSFHFCISWAQGKCSGSYLSSIPKKDLLILSLRSPM